MFDSLIIQFFVLWAVIDPLGTIPVYLIKTLGLSEEEKHKIAFKAILFAGGILLFFIILGQKALSTMQIPLPAFQIAGGLVLLIFSFTMIFGESKSEHEVKIKSSLNELAVYPLAVPSIASPGAMLAVVLMTDSSRYSISDQVITTGIVGLILAITYGLLFFASKIQKIIGNAGAIIIGRVMGLFLCSIAVSHVLLGLKDFITQFHITV